MTGLRSVGMVGVRDAGYYGPQVAAVARGYFADEGIRLRYTGRSGPLGLAAMMDSGEAELVLGGIWRVMRYRLDGAPLRAFAQLNRHADFQILARGEGEVDWAGMRHATLLLTTTLAPSPWFALRHLLARKGLRLDEISIVPCLPVGEAIRLFLEGFGDLIEVEDLDALPLLGRDDISLAARWPQDMGSVPWGVYYSTERRLRKDRPLALATTRALHRGQRWIADAAADEVASLLGEHFDRAAGDLLPLVHVYREQRMWSPSPVIDREAYERWGGILRSAGWLDGEVPFEEAVDPSIAEEVLGLEVASGGGIE